MGEVVGKPTIIGEKLCLPVNARKVTWSTSDSETSYLEEADIPF